MPNSQMGEVALFLGSGEYSRAVFEVYDAPWRKRDDEQGKRVETAPHKSDSSPVACCVLLLCGSP